MGNIRTHSSDQALRIFLMEVISSSTRPPQHYDQHLCQSSALNPTGLWPALSLCCHSVHLCADNKACSPNIHHSLGKRCVGSLPNPVLKICYFTQYSFITGVLLRVSAQTNLSGSAKAKMYVQIMSEQKETQMHQKANGATNPDIP